MDQHPGLESGDGSPRPTTGARPTGVRGRLEGKRARHHRRRFRHRPGRGARLRPRGGGRPDLLPRRARSRTPQETARVVEESGKRCVRVPGDISEESQCQAVDPEGRGRVRQDRRPRQQRRPPDDGRRGGRCLDRAARPHLQDQHLRHVLAGQGGDPAHARGRLDHQRLLRPGLQTLAGPPALRRAPRAPSSPSPRGSPRTSCSTGCGPTSWRRARCGPRSYPPPWRRDGLPVRLAPPRSGRPAQPAELAPAFVFLASDEASYVNGETLGVTGGQPLP